MYTPFFSWYSSTNDVSDEGTTVDSDDLSRVLASVLDKAVQQHMKVTGLRLLAAYQTDDVPTFLAEAAQVDPATALLAVLFVADFLQTENALVNLGDPGQASHLTELMIDALTEGSA